MCKNKDKIKTNNNDESCLGSKFKKLKRKARQDSVFEIYIPD